MNEIIKTEYIQRHIYTLRSVQVILDRELALFYNVETRVLNQAVKRNIERFPDKFCFQLTDSEFKEWKSQSVISNKDKIEIFINKMT
jgi:hypothetical protein